MQAKQVFLDALELEGEERERFVDELRESAPELHARVRSLLAAHEEAGGEARPRETGLFARWGLRCIAEEGPARSEIFATGMTVGDYELISEISSGGSGVVYRARQRSLDRLVALKVLRAGRFASEGEVRRFQVEAEVVARLDHPGIVPIYEVGDHAGRSYFSMKLFEGGCLADRVRGGLWDPRSVARTIRAIARAVQHGHQRGVLHLDLKPSNILLDDEGRPCVADFGIAEHVDAERHRRDMLIGTPAYMAPEQVRGGAAELTVATDVWALGCMLQELLAGEPPFTGESLTDTFERIRSQRPAPIGRTDVPAAMLAILGRCLEKESSARYSTASELADDLDRWLNDLPVRARRYSALERLRLWVRRKPGVAALGVLTVLLLLALAGGALWARGRLEQQLRTSLIAEAEARRGTLEAGRRGQSLQLLQRARAIRPGADVRDAAIATLALTDLELAWEQPVVDELSWQRSYDGASQRFVRGAQDGAIVLCSAADGSVLQRIDGPHDGGIRARFGVDDRVFGATYMSQPGGQQSSLVVWDSAQGRPALQVEHELYPEAFDLSRVGSELVLGTLRGILELRDTTSGELIWSVDAFAQEEVDASGPLAIRMLRFSPDARHLLVVPVGQRRIQVRETSTGALVRRFGEPVWNHAAAWGPRGESIAFGTPAFEIEIWLLDGEAPEQVLRGHQSEIASLEFHPHDDLLVSYSWDETSRLWQAEIGEELARSSLRAGFFSGDGEHLSFTARGRSGQWDLQHDQVFRRLHGHSGKSPMSVQVSSDGRRAVSAGSDGALLWDLDAGRVLARITDSPCNEALFHPDGSKLLTSGGDGFRIVHLNQAGDGLSGRPDQVLSPARSGRATISACGKFVAAVSLVGGNRALLFRLESGQLLREFPATSRLDQISLSPGARWLAGGTWGGHGVFVWDGQTAETVVTLLEEQASAIVRFSPDSRFLMVGIPDEYRMFRTDDWSECARIPRDLAYGGRPGAPAFSADGSLVFVTRTHSVVEVRETVSGELVATLDAPGAKQINFMACSPLGDRLLCTSGANQLQVWELGRLQRRLEELDLSGNESHHEGVVSSGEAMRGRRFE